MLKRIFFLLAVCCSSMAFGQKKNVTDAWFYLNNGDLQKAKTAIDAASVEATTMNLAKTWFYRGNVYFQLYIADSIDKKNRNQYLDETYKSYAKTIELDTKGEYNLDLLMPLLRVAGFYYNEGVLPYNLQSYQLAYDNFSKALEIYDLVNKTYKQSMVDTFATLYKAHAAARLGKYDEASKMYDDLMNVKKYEDAEMYANLSDMAAQQKDTTKAINLLEQGITKFPTENYLRIRQLNLYLFSHRFKEVVDKLNAAIAKEPGRADLYQALGNAYDNTHDTANAAKAYLKAIELDPQNFDSYYSIGAMYYNVAVEVIKEMIKLPDSEQKKYDAMKASSDDLLKKSLPYLEKARDLNSKDMETLSALKEVYARTNQMDKADAVKKEIDALNGK